ncbi:MAG: hypothetical protein H6869_07360 [Rhodospirillales bacterium]|nr:hypothetical protein [Rhodospirillales bacterium]
MSNSNKLDKIKIWHRLNRLKLKAGASLDDDAPGYINPQAVRKAQAEIDDQEENYYREIEAILVRLDSTWDDIQGEQDEKKRKIMIRELLNYANNIKDIALTYKYELMGYFGDSLCRFCEKIDPTREAHRAIIQAHLDVIGVTFQTHIKDNIGQQAEELKGLLRKAIEQHS